MFYMVPWSQSGNTCELPEGIRMVLLLNLSQRVVRSDESFPVFAGNPVFL